jgi:hypothetical protein
MLVYAFVEFQRRYLQDSQEHPTSEIPLKSVTECNEIDIRAAIDQNTFY